MLGRLMLAYPLGVLSVLLTGGFVVGHIGDARTVTFGAIVMGVGLTVASLGADPFASVVATTAGLAAMGYGRGSWGVAMNVEGATIERLVGRAIMPRFHATYILGTVVGAGIGVGAAALGIPVAVHLTTIVVVAVIGLLPAVRHLLPPGTELTPEIAVAVETRSRMAGAAHPAPGHPGDVLRLDRRHRRPWLAVGMVTVTTCRIATGAAGFALFVIAMTAGRFISSPMLDRFGRLPVLRVSAGLAALGVLLMVFGVHRQSPKLALCCEVSVMRSAFRWE